MQTVIAVILDRLDEVENGQKINAEALQDALEKPLQHIAINPFLVYNKGKTLGEVSLPEGSWVSP